MSFIVILIALVTFGTMGAVIATSTIVGFALVYYVLYAIACWKIMTKAGKPGWYGLIPLFGDYQLFKISWDPLMFWPDLVCTLVVNYSNEQEKSTVFTWVASVVLFVIDCIFTNKLAKAFGKGTGFGIGLLLFPSIFMLILGLGSAEYKGPQA